MKMVKKMICKLNKPYPPIKVEKENLEYAEILMKDYAGSGGEDTAIHEYLFQSFVKKEVADTLRGIAEVEMHHLFILGELITLLGGKPFFCETVKNDTCVKPWTSEYVNYTMTLKDMIIVDIKREQETIKRYQKNIEVIHDIYIKKLLQRIIEDEQLHIDCLTRIYNEFI